jgi:hypothetical protein
MDKNTHIGIIIIKDNKTFFSQSIFKIFEKPSTKEIENTLFNIEKIKSFINSKNIEINFNEEIKINGGNVRNSVSVKVK